MACGGFSYGDVLGAGEGWAKSILYHAGAREQFQRFFERNDTFTLGVCNGCQMFAALKEIMPGARQLAALRAQPRRAVRRALLAGRAAPSPSIFLAGMDGSMLPIAVAHGEGRAEFASDAAARGILRRPAWCAARYIEGNRQVATNYPANPNGSPFGIAAITNADGRVTITMPHPGALVPLRAEFLAAGRRRRVQRLVPHVRQRAPLGGLNGD